MHLPERQPADPLLESMMAAAVEAGRVVHEYYRGEFDVRRKADESPVTSADHAAEGIILARLAQAAPQLAVIAEEEVAAGRIPAVGREFFLVDPLDGTREFVQRRGDFTVNIALIRDATPVLGVVYAPATARLFAGDVMRGAAFQADQEPDAPSPAIPAEKRRPIHVRPVPSTGLTVVSSRSHGNPQTEAYLAGYPICERVTVGSSLKFCLLAAGEADLYPRLGPTMEWDTAAGHAVLAAAGGSVWAPGGVPLRYAKPGYRNSHFVATGMLIPRALAA